MSTSMAWKTHIVPPPSEVLERSPLILLDRAYEEQGEQMTGSGRANVDADSAIWGTKVIQGQPRVAPKVDEHNRVDSDRG